MRAGSSPALGTKFKEFALNTKKVEDNTGVHTNEYQDILSTEDCFFEVEHPDPAKRTWYYDGWGIKRKKTPEMTAATYSALLHL